MDVYKPPFTSCKLPKTFHYKLKCLGLLITTLCPHSTYQEKRLTLLTITPGKQFLIELADASEIKYKEGNGINRRKEF